VVAVVETLFLSLLHAAASRPRLTVSAATVRPIL
jgi:hypothetical protein